MRCCRDGLKSRDRRPPAVTAQRLVPASNPLAQPVPPHAAFASIPPAGFIRGKRVSRSGERKQEGDRQRAADQEQENYSALGFTGAGADGEEGSETRRRGVTRQRNALLSPPPRLPRCRERSVRRVSGGLHLARQQSLRLFK